MDKRPLRKDPPLSPYRRYEKKGHTISHNSAATPLAPTTGRSTTGLGQILSGSYIVIYVKPSSATSGGLDSLPGQSHADLTRRLSYLSEAVY
jgi:hypothetical protein